MAKKNAVPAFVPFPSEWHPEKESKVAKLMARAKMHCGRMVGGSKSLYHRFHPLNLVIFNANMVTLEEGKVWHGDLDLSLEGAKLKRVAKRAGCVLFILYESDGRWGNDNSSPEELAMKSRWDTSKGLPALDEEWNVLFFKKERDLKLHLEKAAAKTNTRKKSR